MKKLIGLVLLLSSCVSLTPAAQKLRYVRGDAARFRVTECRRLGNVEGWSVQGVMGKDEAFKEAINAAAERGATHANVLSDGLVAFKGWRTVLEGYVCTKDVGGIGLE